MTYKVIFRKRFDGEANESDNPAAFVDTDGSVVLNAEKAEVVDPPALHSQDVLDEDDSFLSVGTETWEFEIASGREDDFIRALERSQMVIEYEQIDDVV